MRASTRPIGVFDSGLGGLTVLSALARRMPEEHLIYFGDTAHVPYGSKSRQAVARYSLEIARFLERRGIKVLVVACNTSSALALPLIKRAVKVPVVGVVDSGVRAVAAGGYRRVGVIGTEATIASLAYQRALRRALPKAAIAARACPLLVPLVEEGWWDRRVTEEVAREYLRPLLARRIEALVLGCTHYPLLKRTLGRIAGARVALVDSAEETALRTERLLSASGLRRAGGFGRRRYFVSDAPARFTALSSRFLGVRVSRVERRNFGS
ncbi:MAG: glutamate racemase [Elusimicrobia bacterium]|nr:glutamate racemase [Elusimicrobiota bacterium]MDE2236820.1 glutamate racemase [Elusimicrobiota bacterium]MDE2425346.1 glutamate racemase [Elusimicrobiota bacterium]